MRKFLISLISLVAALSFSTGLATAYQHLTTYRIFGDELISVTVGVQGVEAPASLILQIGSSPEEAIEVLIESDGSLEECKQSLDTIKGSAPGYVEILIDQAAQTMNGVMVLHCTVFYQTFGDPL